MAARTELSTLIGIVRAMLRDPAPSGGPAPEFSDDEIQRALDRHRWDEFYVPLACPWEVEDDGTGHATTTWRRFYAPAPMNNWDDGWVLSGPNRLPISDADLLACSADPINGLWSFSPGRHNSLLYLTGRNYDPAGASVYLLTGSLAGNLDQYDLKTPEGAHMTRSQKIANRTAMIAALRPEMRVRVGQQYRAGERWGR